MRIIHAHQYGIPCVVAEEGDTGDAVIARCDAVGAVRRVDGVEYCVEMRPEIGPELWTEPALRVSLGMRTPSASFES